MDHKLGDAFWGIITTHSPSTGAATDADSTPTIKVYEAGTDLALATPGDYLVTNLTTGVYKYWIDWSAGNGFEAGKMYSVVITATIATITQNKQDAIVHCVAKDIDDLNDFDVSSEEVDLGKVKGTALTETSGGNLAANMSEFWDNSDAITTRNVDDVGGAGVTNPNMILDTDVAGVATQTQLTLTAGPNDDDALNNQAVVLYDITNSNSPSVRVVVDYDQATKLMTLDSAPDFTVAVGDLVKVFVTAPGTVAPTAAQVADAVWDEDESDHDSSGSFGEAVHDVHNAETRRNEFDIDNGDRVIMEDDGVTPRITLRHTEVDSTTVGMVPQ